MWVFGGGLESQRASVVATDGTVTDGPYPETKEVLGGFAVVDVPSREEALEWAAKIAVACRCAQEVRELLPDPTVLGHDADGARRCRARDHPGGRRLSRNIATRHGPPARHCALRKGLEMILAGVSYRRECVRGEGAWQPSGLPVSRGA